MKRGIPERGDIWCLDLDPTKGAEQQGSRPVVVLTPYEFNRLGLVLVCPITQGGEFARAKGFTVSLIGSGCAIQGVVLCHQPRTLAYKARGARYLEHLPDDITAEIIARFHTLLD